MQSSAGAERRQRPTRRRSRRFWPLALLLLAMMAALAVAAGLSLQQPAGGGPMSLLPAPGDSLVGGGTPAQSGPGWATVFVHNLYTAAWGFVGGSLSLGLLALVQATQCGTHVGRLVGGLAQASRDAGGAGIPSAAAAGLLPHGLLEYPALLLVWVMSARRGLALGAALWRRRPRGALGGIRGDLRVLVTAVVPLLLVSAVLEDRVSPTFMDHYLLRLGRFPAVTAERRLGPLFACSQASLSPRGDSVAAVDPTSRRLLLLDPSSGAVHPLSQPPAGSYFSGGSPSWSPTGGQLALTRYRDQTEGGGLIIFDLRVRRFRVVRNQPYGEVRHARWSPRANEVACILIQRDRSGKGPTTSNIWLVDLHSEQWRPVTTFPATYTIPRLGGLDWSPDGRRLAFIFTQRGTPAGVPDISSSDRYWLSLVDADGAGLRKLAPLPCPTPLAWSPDGTRIAVVESLPEARGIPETGDVSSAAVVSVVDAVTGARTSGVTRAWSNSDPSWDPDGRHLLYVRLLTCVKGGPIA